MRPMTPAEIRAFLQAGIRTAKLATAGADGRPHVAPVWFVLDGEELVFTTAGSSAKARNLRVRPEVSLCVDDERPPLSFVTMHGTASIEQSPPDLLDWTTRIAHRYVGADAAVEVGRRNADLDDLVVRIRPTAVIAQADLLG
jgi:PPOX class probable F420-dependent enzyme